MTDILTLTNVSKKYPGSKSPWAVEGVNLEVREGEFFCFVGPSGCGKSTVLKMIVGLEEATAGSISRPDDISMVFQSEALFPWLSVKDNVAFGLEMKNTLAGQISETVSKNLKMVGLENFRDKYPRELSGGQRQRVGIARALAVSPKLLLLDEPFSAIDPLTTEDLHRDLLRIWHDMKLTIVMVSHLLEEAVLLSDRVGVMKEAKLKGIIEVDLPRRRSDLSKNFYEEVAKVRRLLD